MGFSFCQIVWQLELVLKQDSNHQKEKKLRCEPKKVLAAIVPLTSPPVFASSLSNSKSTNLHFSSSAHTSRLFVGWLRIQLLSGCPLIGPCSKHLSEILQNSKFDIFQSWDLKKTKRYTGMGYFSSECWYYSYSYC